MSEMDTETTENLDRDEYITAEEAAQYLKVSKITLARWRRENNGPKWYTPFAEPKPGRPIRYKYADLDDFMRQGNAV